MKWIGANKELPKHGERVFATYRTEGGKALVGVVIYDRVRGWCWPSPPGGSIHHGTRVTHWQSLPTPAEE